MLQLPANDPVNTTLGFVIARTPQDTVWDDEDEAGALQTRVAEPDHVAVASPGVQAILYSRLVVDPVNPAALHV